MKILTRPTPIWLSALMLAFTFVTISSAAVVQYSGSFNVLSGGHFTDTTQSASSVACYNASHQITSGACASVNPTFNNITGGTGTFSGLLTGAGITAGTGTVRGASDGSTNTYLAPGYNGGGSALASTWHTVFFTIQVGAGGVTRSTLSGGACSSNACYQVSGWSALSGASAFSSQYSYHCIGDDQDSTGTTLNGLPSSGTAFTLTWLGPSGVVGVGSTDHIAILCSGT